MDKSAKMLHDVARSCLLGQRQMEMQVRCRELIVTHGRLFGDP